MASDKEQRTFWVQVFSDHTWREFLKSGSEVTGFRDKRWPIIKKIRTGDYILCYVSKVGYFVGILEARSSPYIDNSPIWSGELFPCRIEISVLAKLPLQLGLPIRSLRDELTIFESRNWGAHFMGSPSKLNAKDASILMKRIMQLERRMRHASGTSSFG